jgi:hypothetical protein
MNPQELASYFSKIKMGGAEGAIVLALLFGPRRKKNIWAALPHHSDTLADALAKLVAAGHVRIEKGRHTKLVLVRGENSVAIEDAPVSFVRLSEKTPARRTSLFQDRPADQQKQVMQRLGVTRELLNSSPLMQERAENLARQMFGK